MALTLVSQELQLNGHQVWSVEIPWEELQRRSLHLAVWGGKRCSQRQPVWLPFPWLAMPLAMKVWALALPMTGELTSVFHQHLSWKKGELHCHAPLCEISLGRGSLVHQT